jgi:hypothetical protein
VCAFELVVVAAVVDVGKVVIDKGEEVVGTEFGRRAVG